MARLFGRCFFLFLLCCWTELVCAQQQAVNWYFGQHAGIRFTPSGVQVVSGGQTNSPEGVGTISDAQGNLLFYSDGITIWNRQHQIMTNGWGLFGHPSSTQSGVIVPQPGNDSLYYLFTVDAGSGPNGLCYSVVNMRHQGGLGEVVQKNEHLADSTCEQITAVRHCNGRDVWIITRTFNTNRYVAWLLTAGGLTAAPVQSLTGGTLTMIEQTSGYLKASHDGRTLVGLHSIYPFMEITDFDAQTGIVSNLRHVAVNVPYSPETITEAYGLEFSPSGRYLYYTARLFLSPVQLQPYLIQLDLGQTTPAAIEASRVVIDSTQVLTNLIDFSALQLGSDGKIYRSRSRYDYLGVINDPDNPGLSCHFVNDGIYLQGALCEGGLPNFLQSFFREIDFQSTGSCLSLDASFSVSNSQLLDSVRWDFDDPVSGTANTATGFTAAHNFSAPGSYLVRLLAYRRIGTIGCGNPVDTIRRIIVVGQPKPRLGPDRDMCAGDSLRLVPAAPLSNALWSDGSTGPDLIVNVPGLYWVETVVNGCPGRDTVVVTGRALPDFTLGPDVEICSGASLQLAPQPALSNALLHWDDGSTSPTRTISSPGRYWLRVEDASYHCVHTDTVLAILRQLPALNLGRDTSLCAGTLLLGSTLPGQIPLLWSTGATQPAISVDQSGVYWVETSQGNCVFRDSIMVTFVPYPVVNLGADTAICAGSVLILQAGNVGAQYRWQDGSTQATYAVSGAGLFFVGVSRNGCTASDSIRVSVDQPPLFSFVDLQICAGQSLRLAPRVQRAGTDYSWSTGETDSFLLVAAPGSYGLTLANRCGTYSAQARVEPAICDLYVPGAFTPNGDGKNDRFKGTYQGVFLSYRLAIWNRWGEKVFESNNPAMGWDGSFHGVAQPMDVYIWTVDIKSAGQPKSISQKGTFVLIR